MNYFSLKNIAIATGIISVVVIALALIYSDLNNTFRLDLIFRGAEELASGRAITSDVMPIGYAGFLGACIRGGGEDAIPFCQAFIYAGIIFSALWLLYLSGVTGRFLAIGVLAVAIHPTLIVNIWRIHDGNLTVLLLFLFLSLAIYTVRTGRVWSIIALGTVTGALFTVRTNTVLIVLPLLFLFAGFSEGRFSAVKTFLDKKILVTAFLFLLCATLIFVGVNLLTKGKPMYVPDQGYYNLFSGANEYSAKYLLTNYNSEYSHQEALRTKGIEVGSIEDLYEFPSEKYKDLSLDFIRKQPIDYLKLSGLKLVTLLRPGYHVPGGFGWASFEGVKRILKIILALPFFVWLFVLYKTRKNFWEKENLFVFLAVMLYLLPFVIINADPRYRFPIDIVLLADIFSRIAPRLNNLTFFKKEL